jgi:hypothetical protein
MKKNLFILTICIVCSISVFSQSKKKWEQTQSLNSITAYEDFIKKYPAGTYTIYAKQGLEQLEFLNAKQLNTVKAYEDFLKKYTDGKNSELAKQGLEQLDFLNAKQQNTIKAYEDFLSKHGKAMFASEASTKLRNLRFEVLNSHPTISGCEEYLHFYSFGSDVDTANQLLDQMSFKESEILNTEEAYESYLSRFPNGQSTSIAISNLQEIRFINTHKIKTVEAYEHFLNLYPEGAKASQLREELIGLRKFEESRKLVEIPLMIDAIVCTIRKDILRSIKVPLKLSQNYPLKVNLFHATDGTMIVGLCNGLVIHGNANMRISVPKIINEPNVPDSLLNSEKPMIISDNMVFVGEPQGYGKNLLFHIERGEYDCMGNFNIDDIIMYFNKGTMIFTDDSNSCTFSEGSSFFYKTENYIYSNTKWVKN